MNGLFGTIYGSKQASKTATELNGRNVYLQLAMVTDNNDNDRETGRRRIKATTASKGGKVSTDWLTRCLAAPTVDEEMPKIGQTVLIGYIDGNPHKGVYFGVLMNGTNPPLEKGDAINDRRQAVTNDHHVTVGNNDTLEVGLDWQRTVKNNGTVSVGKSLRLQNDMGAYLELNEAGFAVLGDAFGHRWVLGGSTGGNGGSGSDWEWDANGASINIVNAGEFTVNGKSIASVGARDTDNDTLITRGW